MEAYFVAKDSNLVTDCIKHLGQIGEIGERRKCHDFQNVHNKHSQDNALEFLI